jgi:caa(3)-type oxidase subunit IV
MSSDEHIHHPNYVRVWAVLLVLLVVSVLGPLTGIRWLILITAFGVAMVKAYLVAKNFMHVTIERRFIPYLLVVCLVLVLVLFVGVAPDVMKHRGLNWENYSARQAVEAGMRSAAPKRE